MAERPLRFGVSITPDARDVAGAVALARAADAAGLDLVTVQDHPYQPDHLDAPLFAGHLAGRTSRVRFMTGVADLALRPAPMLAKAAATLDVLTGGRFDLGVGTGGYPDAVAGMGGTPWRGAAAVTAAGEALRILREALRADAPVVLDGEHHRVGGYRPGPARPVPIWLGAQGPRMLGVLGALADGWVSPLNIYVPPAEVPARQAAIDAAAERAGRDPSAVRRLYNVLGAIGASAGQGLRGDSETWARVLAGWAHDLRFDTFVFWPVADHLGQVRRFAEEVVPRVRELTA
ncbi:LLM class flavin-dependent oxidoreductase [Dactylosporangium sp. NBC_01737]|uniref:LLM class flavin-dependent oxidoreductase n=1 Tax=Dactylosporangium sp. NBC_01737 TaxID=2975959 RepID=UPI002E16833C|nr:LLM class flavin-dependent oxidoreductase [Dactylosporangium sp. NBC_01737]